MSGGFFNVADLKVSTNPNYVSARGVIIILCLAQEDFVSPILAN